MAALFHLVNVFTPNIASWNQAPAVNLDKSVSDDQHVIQFIFFSINFSTSGITTSIKSLLKLRQWLKNPTMLSVIL